MQLILIAAGVATEELRCVLKEDHKSCGTLYSTSTQAVPSSTSGACRCEQQADAPTPKQGSMNRGLASVKTCGAGLGISTAFNDRAPPFGGGPRITQFSCGLLDR